jgi:hypothetical protein
MLLQHSTMSHHDETLQPPNKFKNPEKLDEDEDEEDEDVDTRFLDVCVDGDVEDLVQLLEEMARAGETLGPDIINCVDNSGRVSRSKVSI